MLYSVNSMLTHDQARRAARHIWRSWAAMIARTPKTQPGLKAYRERERNKSIDAVWLEAGFVVFRLPDNWPTEFRSLARNSTVASAERAGISNGEGLGVCSPEFAPERVTVQAPTTR